MSSIHQLSPATANAALIPSPSSRRPPTAALDDASVSSEALRIKPSAVRMRLFSRRPSLCNTAGSNSSHSIALPRISKKTCPLMSCPPRHCPPIALHAACEKTSFASPCSTFSVKSVARTWLHLPPVHLKLRSTIPGPKNH